MPLPSSEFLQEFLRRDGEGEIYPDQVFVETGSHRGDGIQFALDAGFGAIYSCDISEFSYGWCCHRFKDVRPVVNLHCADSRDFLREVLTHAIGSPSTFWLDAHWCGGDGEMNGRDNRYARDGNPLLEELAIIRSFGTTTHTILVDDVRMWGQDDWFPTRDAILAELRAINPDYRIEFRDGRDHPGDILVARA